MLWTREELKSLFNLDVDASGVSIDTRNLNRGDLFFGIVGENGVDGATFFKQAKDMGAAGVVQGLKNLEKLGQASRARNVAKRIAVTGSVGKTGTKELLATAFGALGKTHASIASYNNHIGVPLTLARMPRDTEFGIFETGMNHAGELRELSNQIRPDIALITWIAPAHLEFFGTIEAIADAKAEIFDGLNSGGTVILPESSPQFDTLLAHAQSMVDRPRILTFGWHGSADVSLVNYESLAQGSLIKADVAGTIVDILLPLQGKHVASNTLGVLACVHAAGGDLRMAAAALEETKAAPGRGERFRVGGITVMDESYNANPESMRATLEVLAAAPSHDRRIAILGDMFELGDASHHLHKGLADIINKLPITQVITCGSAMKNLHDALPSDQRGPHFDTSADLAASIGALLHREDCVLIKGSNGMKMKVVLEAIRSTFK